MLLRLTLRSLRARFATVGLCVLSLALSVALALSVERLRAGAWESFAGAISGVDLIVGARGGSNELLLYSVFHMGNATNNLTYESYTELAAHPAIDWIAPISLGDSHRGFRVVGTNRSFFERIRVHNDRPLAMAEGQWFDDLFDVVLGADVAARLGYDIGDSIVVAHGIGRAAFREHDDKPFRVSGILEKTGSPIDRSLYVSLEAYEAIHIDWHRGAPIPGRTISAEQVRQMTLEPRAVTAAFLGLNSRAAAFGLQRAVNEYRAEPLTAILPGVALRDLWRIVGAAEKALAAISVLVAVAALLGMAAMLLATLNERRREMAIFRAVGARPRTVFGLLMAEAGLIAAAGVLLGVIAHYAVMAGFAPMAEARLGLYLPLKLLNGAQVTVLAGVAIGAALCGAPPAIRAYRMSLAAGMQLRV